MGSFQIRDAGLGIRLIEVPKYPDERGSLTEVFNESVLKVHLGVHVQLKSKAGVLRGLHCTLSGSKKLVRVIQGEIMDVAVDLRRGSATFGQHRTFNFWEDCGFQVLIPEGFAHGFVSWTDSIVEYKTDKTYDINDEKGLAWNDEEVDIYWGKGPKTLSIRDRNNPTLQAWRKMHENCSSVTSL